MWSSLKNSTAPKPHFFNAKNKRANFAVCMHEHIKHLCESKKVCLKAEWSRQVNPRRRRQVRNSAWIRIDLIFSLGKYPHSTHRPFFALTAHCTLERSVSTAAAIWSAALKTLWPPWHLRTVHAHVLRASDAFPMQSRLHLSSFFFSRALALERVRTLKNLPRSPGMCVCYSHKIPPRGPISPNGGSLDFYPPPPSEFLFFGHFLHSRRSALSGDDYTCLFNTKGSKTNTVIRRQPRAL